MAREFPVRGISAIVFVYVTLENLSEIKKMYRRCSTASARKEPAPTTEWPAAGGSSGVPAIGDAWYTARRRLSAGQRLLASRWGRRAAFTNIHFTILL